MKQTDFLVIGSGIAGLTFALKAAKFGSVAILTKKSASDSNTSWAQGGIACVMSEEDSFKQHVEDTLDAGAGLCNEAVVQSIVADAPQSIQDLIEYGVEFDTREVEGHESYDLGKEGGHTKRRILHSRDTTGMEISQKLLAYARCIPGITFYENYFAIDLITTSKLGYPSEDRVVGVYALNETSGEVEIFRSDRVILATGGCGRVYQYTTNPNVATGDGVAMAWRAGAVISNMEFIQFHPTCLYHPKQKSFLISEVLRGEGGRLIDKEGQEFMHKYDVRKSLAPRDIVARAIDSEIKRTGHPCVFLDISHLSKAFIEQRFPNIYQTCLRLGIDASVDPIPVVPAAHYQCGGVQTNEDGATSVKGLYAVGEVACTGLHGANRLASNSLLEGVVMARRAVHHATHKLPISRHSIPGIEIPVWESGDAADLDELVVIYHNWDEIRKLMWDYVSIVRTTKRLTRAATRLKLLHNEIKEYYWNFKVTSELLELRNLIDTASLIVESALNRRESRGAHYTLDHPESRDMFLKDTLIRQF